MRRLVLTLLALVLLGSPALALSGAQADGEDRFPFVVEINLDGQLLCSGTVLYPRIVVTSAHCVQEKLAWPGARQIYIDKYVSAARLSVSVTHGETVVRHAVAAVEISPDWRSGLINSGNGARFAHDIALLITEAPIEVGLPPSLPNLAGADGDVVGEPWCPKTTGGATPETADADGALRDALLERLGHHGVLVAFGAETCTFRSCADAGIRRFQNVSIRESADCFADNRGRLRGLPAEFADRLPLSVWCTESSVLPGDSGGALLVEGPMGELYFLGVISAQQGRLIALSGAPARERSLATALYPSFAFIEAYARKLGYRR